MLLSFGVDKEDLETNVVFGRKNKTSNTKMKSHNIIISRCMLFLFHLQCISSRHNSHRKSSLFRRDTTESGRTNNEAIHQYDDRQFEKLIRLAPDYNIHEHPAPKNGTPLHVDFQINLRNLLEVNEVSQILTLETTIRMFWLDERVSIKPEFLKNHTNETEYITLNPKSADYFWIPDIFVDQAKELRIPTYFVRPASIRVYNNSKIRYATRVNFDVACKMEFHQYPTDMQTCEIKLESFGYTNKQMRFKWMDKGRYHIRNIYHLYI